MAANDCFCGDDPKSLGLPDCVTIEKQVEKLGLTTLKNSTGGEFRILKTDLTAANFQTLINAPDPSDRLYFTAPTKSPEVTRDDSTFEDFDDGTSFFVRENPQTMILPFPGTDRQYMDNLKSWKCQDMGYYAVDKVGQILYRDKGDEYAYPIPVNKGTHDFKYMMATGTTVAKTWWRHQWDIAISDNCIRVAETDISPADLEGLLPVAVDYTTQPVTTTTFTALLTLNGYSNLPVEGLLPGDFTLENITTTLPIVIGGVVESAPGVYDFTIPAQTSADVMRLIPAKDGFDFYTVSQTDITIP